MIVSTKSVFLSNCGIKLLNFLIEKGRCCFLPKGILLELTGRNLKSGWISRERKHEIPKNYTVKFKSMFKNSTKNPLPNIYCHNGMERAVIFFRTEELKIFVEMLPGSIGKLEISSPQKGHLLRLVQKNPLLVPAGLEAKGFFLFRHNTLSYDIQFLKKKRRRSALLFVKKAQK